MRFSANDEDEGWRTRDWSRRTERKVEESEDDEDDDIGCRDTMRRKVRWETGEDEGF